MRCPGQGPGSDRAGLPPPAAQEGPGAGRVRGLCERGLLGDRQRPMGPAASLVFHLDSAASGSLPSGAEMTFGVRSTHSPIKAPLDLLSLSLPVTAASPA